MDQNNDDRKPEPVSRRKFIAALGAAAIAGGILQSTRKADAKLGIYSYWNTADCTTCPSTATGYNQQFEFYSYYGYTGHPANTGETGNEGVASVSSAGVTTLSTTDLPYYSAQDYLNSFNYVIYDELYVIYPQLLTAWENALATYFAYRSTLEGLSACTGTVTACS